MFPVPDVGNSVPRRGGGVTRTAGKLVLRLFGWSFEGEFPNLPKMVIAVAPHTSNWDFFFGIAAIFSLNIRAHWIGKHTLFRRPFGWFMRWLGGKPVIRDAHHGVVDQVVEIIRGNDQFIFGLAPEGTRKRVIKWRTGFYYIALEAGIPVLLAFFDYGKKKLGFGPLIFPSGDIEKDLASMKAFFSTKTGKFPENF